MEDSQQLFNALKAHKNHLAPWIDWAGHINKVPDALKFIEDALHDQSMQEAMYLGIFWNNVLIGSVNMQDWKMDAKHAQIGYWIVKDYEGKGIIHTSLVHFLKFLFEKVGLNKIEVHFTIANNKSAKVAEKLGFKIEGILRQCVWRQGLIEDLVIAGMLRKEWDEKKSALLNI